MEGTDRKHGHSAGRYYCRDGHLSRRTGPQSIMSTERNRRLGLEDPEARDRETKEAGLIKGETACNRRACQMDLTRHGFRWWNKGTEKWYCQGCAFRINEFPDVDGTPLCIREDELPK